MIIFGCGGQISDAGLNFSDDFTRANSNLTADPNWTLIGGTASGMQVASNRLEGFTASAVAAAPPTGQNRIYVQATVSWSAPPNGNTMGPAFIIDANNWLLFGVNSGNGFRSIISCAAGVQTSTFVSVTLAGNGDLLRLEVDVPGNTVRVYATAVLLASYTFTQFGLPLTGQRYGIVSQGNIRIYCDSFACGGLA